MTAAARHLLVTNDFPPKVGGIQVYLWELWRRLDPDTFSVLTSSSHPDAAAFDADAAASGISITRVPSGMLFPTPGVVRQVRECARRQGAGLLVVDPALPLGLAAAVTGMPYALVLHGAEVTVPGRLPLTRRALAGVLRRARLAVCAGGYPAAEALGAAGAAMPAIVEVPPGVDTARFSPMDDASRSAGRAELGLPEDALVVLGVSRLVPRKGFDVLLDAAASLVPEFPSLVLVIAGDGRDRHRLEARAAANRLPARFLGRVPDRRLPVLYGSADVFSMACRNRWAGLEQEGFGIVFLEAAAAGVPQVAGASGGADEAVVDGQTGLVVRRPDDPRSVAAALRALLADAGLRRRMGQAARTRAVRCFDYDLLAPRLAAALSNVPG